MCRLSAEHPDTHCDGPAWRPEEGADAACLAPWMARGQNWHVLGAEQTGGHQGCGGNGTMASGHRGPHWDDRNAPKLGCTDYCNSNQ